MPRRSQGLQPGHSGTSRSCPSPVTELLGMRTFGMILVLPARSATSVRHAASCSHGESVPPPCPPARFCVPPLPPVAAGLTADPAADWPGGDREPAGALPSPACSARSARGLAVSASARGWKPTGTMAPSPGVRFGHCERHVNAPPPRDGDGARHAGGQGPWSGGGRRRAASGASVWHWPPVASAVTSLGRVTEQS